MNALEKQQVKLEAIANSDVDISTIVNLLFEAVYTILLHLIKQEKNAEKY